MSDHLAKLSNRSQSSPPQRGGYSNRGKFKPYGVNNPRGRGRGRGNAGQRSQSDPQANRRTPQQNTQTNKPKQKFDVSPKNTKPKVASKPVNRDKNRCHYCHQFDHWIKDCPERKKDQQNLNTLKQLGTIQTLQALEDDTFGSDEEGEAMDIFRGIQDYSQEESEGEDHTLTFMDTANSTDTAPSEDSDMETSDLNC